MELTESGGTSFPVHHEVLPRPPSIPINIERELYTPNHQQQQHQYTAPDTPSRSTQVRTFVAQQKLVLDPIYRHRLRLRIVRPPSHEIEALVPRIEQSLRVERLGVDDLEPVHARDAELRLEEVDRARLDRDVKLLHSPPHPKKPLSTSRTQTQEGKEEEGGKGADLVYPQRIISPLQQLPKRRLAPPPHVLVDRLEDLDRARQRARLDDADERAADARPGLEEGRVRGYAFGALEARGGIHLVERVEREGDHLALCRVVL